MKWHASACWLPVWTMVRTWQSLSIRWAIRGRCSQTATPGRLVEIGLNSPRYSIGASGFMSNVSMLLMPPSVQRRMQLISWPALAAADAWLASNCGKERPNSDSPPTRKNARR
jgi:hypothetical protein